MRQYSVFLESSTRYRSTGLNWYDKYYLETVEDIKSSGVDPMFNLVVYDNNIKSM